MSGSQVMSEKRVEKERKKEIEYVRTYVRILKQQTADSYKFHATISVEPSIHQAVKFLAHFFGVTASDLYVEGVLKHLEELIPKLPESIQLNIIRQISMKQEADPEITGLKIDIVHEQLAYLIKRVKESPKNAFLKDALRKHLVQSLKLASTSGNDSLKQLVTEARELLRGSPL